jgi:hypothetical protein
MELASVSTNVITKSNISTSTDLLTMATSWIQLEAHLAWHVYPDFTGYVWEVMVKANGSTTAYSLDGIPTVTFNNPPDCLQPNTVYYLKSTTSSFTSPKIYSFHTSVANADADIKIDFVAGEMGTGTSFNLIFIRKNYRGYYIQGIQQPLNKSLAKDLGEIACCYKDTFENMTKATFYFPPAGREITLGGGVGMGLYPFQQPGATAFAPPTTLWSSTPIAGTPLFTGGYGYYTITLYRYYIHISWGNNYWESTDLPVTHSGPYTGHFNESATWPQFGSGDITYHTPLVIPDLRISLPDAYFFVATGHHISLGSIDTTLTYDRGSGCYVSDVFNYYNIPGRMWFKVDLVPRDYGGADDWLGNVGGDGYTGQTFENRLWLNDPAPSPNYSYYTLYNSGPLAIYYSYYQRAIKSRYNGFYYLEWGQFFTPLFVDDLRTSTFWRGSDKFAIRSDSSAATIERITPPPS